MKLNLGCGRTRKDGWTNVDISKVDGVTDVVCDLDGSDLMAHFAEDSVTESVGEHVIEHLHRPLEFMAALWHVTAPGGTATFETPYGSSDDAWEDPTHTRPYFMNTWGYFSQPFYFRADYGYRADWRVKELVLAVDQDRFAPPAFPFAHYPPNGILEVIQKERNVVRFMRTTLEAVKPAREPLAELQEPLPLAFALVAS